MFFRLWGLVYDWRFERWFFVEEVGYKPNVIGEKHTVSTLLIELICSLLVNAEKTQLFLKLVFQCMSMCICMCVIVFVFVLVVVCVLYVYSICVFVYVFIFFMGIGLNIFVCVSICLCVCVSVHERFLCNVCMYKCAWEKKKALIVLFDNEGLQWCWWCMYIMYVCVCLFVCYVIVFMYMYACSLFPYFLPSQLSFKKRR